MRVASSWEEAGLAQRILGKAGIRLVWFDSIGAKSSCIVVERSGLKVVVDPGAAAMQPSYPLPEYEKARLRREALRRIEDEARKASIIIVTHYHYDHHARPWDKDIRDPKKMWLEGKTLVLKNPNMYINESQWERARLFLSSLLSMIGDSIENHLVEPQETVFEDPVEKLVEAHSRDYGDYTDRRKQLLEKGKQWFSKLASKFWSSKPWIEEMVLGDGTRILWGDGRSIDAGPIRIRVLEPHFHGIEYDRTGWVTPLVIECGGRKIVYTSDLMGPVIEDYAEAIARMKPDIVILDGPPTYLFPYMLNKVNLRRAVENAITIVKSKPKLIVYDHHLLREKRWRQRVAEALEEAGREGVLMLTAAECMGEKPLIDRVSEKSI